MHRLFSGALILASLLMLSGCGIPDGIAYGIKSIERNRSAAQPQPSTAAPAAVAPEPDPAPLPTPVRRDSVEVEQLPPPQ